MKIFPTYFISHGGGPWPYMKEEFGSAYDQLENSLKNIHKHLGMSPKAIVIISGHWEEQEFKVMATPNPPMFYDYSGFPAKTYQVQYSAPGSPELASKVQGLIRGVGFSCSLNQKRRFDHGTFVPLWIAYPEANIPVIQVSMRSDLDPEAHIKLGRALAPLRTEGVLIIGSGLSYHNLRKFQTVEAHKPSSEFDSWLNQVLIKYTGNERTQKLLSWVNAPSARQAHPREDHLIPLMVAVGAAESEKCEVVYHEDNFMGGVTVSSFRFGV